jgi:2-dehydropantoate 2-reductase
VRVAVLGAGAIGGYYGGRLAQAGQDVRFLYHSEYDAVRERGLRIESVDGNWQGPVQAFRDADAIGPCDAALVCFKSAQSRLFPDLLPKVLAPDGVAFCLMNGLGHEELLAEVAGPKRVAAGAAFICSERGEPGVVRHFAAGGLAVAPYFPEGRGRIAEACRELSERFSASGVRCRTPPDGMAMKWEKLLWNIPFSGISVYAGGITTDRIMADAALRSFARGLMDEVLDAARACGVAIDPRVADRNMAETESMGAYRPSMLVDFQLGRPVEWESIVAEPLRRGEEAGARLPRMRKLLEGIRSRL